MAGMHLIGLGASELSTCRRAVIASEKASDSSATLCWSVLILNLSESITYLSLIRLSITYLSILWCIMYWYIILTFDSDVMIAEAKDGLFPTQLACDTLPIHGWTFTGETLGICLMPALCTTFQESPGQKPDHFRIWTYCLSVFHTRNGAIPNANIYPSLLRAFPTLHPNAFLQCLHRFTIWLNLATSKCVQKICGTTSTTV